MTPEVKTALAEIGTAYKGCTLDAADDGQGGALVTLHGVELDGSPYSQADTFVGFQLTHTYPYADVYPHFVRHDLSRRDGKALGDGMSIGSFRDHPVVQISRRSNKHDPASDTALLKLMKVLRWLKSHP